MPGKNGVCKRGGLEAQIQKHENVAVVFGQKGCGGCPPWYKKVAEMKKSGEIPKGAKVIKVVLGQNDAGCETLADSLKVQYTPTTVVYHKGKMVAKIVPKDGSEGYTKSAAKIKKAMKVKN